MEKIIIFFSDIVGTYYNTTEGTIRKNALVQFVNNLEELRINNNADKLYFSFLSTDTPNLIKYAKNELSNYVNAFSSNIILDKQFYDEGYLDSDGKLHPLNDSLKPIKIINYTHELQEKYIVEDIYYADDSKFNIELFQKIKNKLNFDVNSHVLAINNSFDNEAIISTQNQELFGVNELLEKINEKSNISSITTHRGFGGGLS